MIIRFTQPSLGSVQRRINGQTVYCLHRTAEGKTMFLPSWWRAITREASNVLNIYQAEVLRIRWDPEVSGDVTKYRRYVGTRKKGRARFALHEAFDAGSRLTARCLVPSSICLDMFQRILDLAGRYYGISAYRPGQYGTFEVLNVAPISSICSAVPNMPVQEPDHGSRR